MEMTREGAAHPKKACFLVRMMGTAQLRAPTDGTRPV